MDLHWTFYDGESCIGFTLIRCLPPLWLIFTSMPIHFRQELKRAMTLDDWSIFCKYNHRLRSLYEIGTLLGQHRNLGCPWLSSLLPSIAPQPDVSYLECTQWSVPAYSVVSDPRFDDTQFLCGLLRIQVWTICTVRLVVYPDVVSFGLSFSLSESGDASVVLQSWSYLTSAKTGSSHTIPVQFAYTTS
jgi:hypothetical protein